MLSLAAALVSAAMPGCAHNTVDASGDGRLFLLVDMPPRVSGGTIRVNVEVENLDPVEMVICNNPQTSSAQLCRGAENPLTWTDVQYRPIDLTESVIAGGSEVRFFVRDNEFDENQVTFKVDGNTTVRLYIDNPELGGSRHVLIELTVQQGVF
ncbi:hypothetical protein ACFL6X_05965 [Candidatus Latescibacterota bacterium]